MSEWLQPADLAALRSLNTRSWPDRTWSKATIRCTVCGEVRALIYAPRAAFLHYCFRCAADTLHTSERRVCGGEDLDVRRQRLLPGRQAREVARRERLRLKNQERNRRRRAAGKLNDALDNRRRRAAGKIR